MSYSVRLVPYKGETLIRAKDHDGMISPEGEFYIVAERGDMDWRHDAFAEGYLSIRKNINVEYRNGCAEIDVPNPKYAGHKVTDEQFRTLRGLVNINHDSEDVLMQAFRYERGMEDMQFQYGKSFQKRR